VRVLLDTHVAVWMSMDSPRLRPETRQLLSSIDTTRLWSAASSWELAIKWQQGKVRLPEEPGNWIPRMLSELKIESIQIRHDHAIRAAALPLLHKDPFDRMLVAQAEIERAALVTADGVLSKYDVEVIPATA
jgi:PIN domain nuclease of toxin-antitoxin system